MIILNYIVSLTLLLTITFSCLELLSDYRCKQSQQTDVLHYITETLNSTSKLKESKKVHCSSDSLIRRYTRKSPKVFKKQSYKYVIKYGKESSQIYLRHGLSTRNSRYEKANK